MILIVFIPRGDDTNSKLLENLYRQKIAREKKMRVMVPIDDMPYSFAALESILQRNWPEKTRFLLCRVVEPNEALTSSPEMYHPDEHNKSLANESNYHERIALKWLNGIADVFKWKNKDVETKTLTGDITSSLCECAREWSADYIVMGSHERNERERAWLGSIAADVAQHADCSVELVRPGNMHEMLLREDFHLDDVSKLNLSPRKILIPLDFSENSLEAIRFLCGLKGLEHTEVFLVTVAKPKGAGFVSNQIGQTLDGTQPLESESIIKLNHQCNIVRMNTRLYSIGVRVLRGNTVQAILEFANLWQAELIAFATRGETNGNNPVVGSIARGIMDGAKCSTLAIKPGYSDLFEYCWQTQNITVAK